MDLPLPDVSDAKSGIQDLMVGPLNLLNHLTGAVIPGMTFLSLLWLHGKLNVPSIMSTNVFGYKTMVCLGLIASYVVGKVLITPAILLAVVLRAAVRKSGTAPVGSPTSIPKITPVEQWLSKQQPATRQVFTGAVSAPLYDSKSPFMHALSAMNAERSFFAAMWVCFLVVSFTAPGIQIRLLEIVLCVSCAGAAYQVKKEYDSQVALYLGAAIAGLVGRMSPEDRKLVLTLLQALGNLANQSPSAPRPPNPETPK